MFFIVMLFNIRIISKNKLIDLLKASRTNEKIKTNNSVVSILIFIASILILGTSYYMAWKYSITPKNINFPRSIILGVVGTFLFFMGLAGFLTLVLQKNPKIYLKNLNMFLVKQFNNKINTNFISMSIISLMLFMTIIILSSSFGIKTRLENNLVNITKFDATVELRVLPEDKNETDVNSVQEALKLMEIDFNDYNTAEINLYDTDIKVSDLLLDKSSGELKKDLEKYIGTFKIVKLSEYNEYKKLKNEEELVLKDNTAMLLAKNEEELEAISKLKNEENNIEINKKEYVIDISNGLEEMKYYNLIILADDSIQDTDIFNSTMYVNNKDGNSEELDVIANEITSTFYDSDGYIKEDLDYKFTLTAETREQIYNSTRESIGTILYVGIYLGFVFFISSAAALAIQQLTDASDSKDRYKILKRIGVSDELINKTIFRQILIYFLTPLILAIINSIMGLIILERLSTHAGLLMTFKLGPTIFISLAMIVIIYGSYLYAAYSGYKNILNSK